MGSARGVLDEVPLVYASPVMTLLADSKQRIIVRELALVLCLTFFGNGNHLAGAYFFATILKIDEKLPFDYKEKFVAILVKMPMKITL